MKSSYSILYFISFILLSLAKVSITFSQTIQSEANETNKTRYDKFLDIVDSNGAYFLLIPNEIIGRDILLTSRLTADAEKSFNNGWVEGFRGSLVNENVFRFEEKGDSIAICNMRTKGVTLPDNGCIYKPTTKITIAREKGSRNHEIVINISNYLKSDNDDVFILNRPEAWGNFITELSSINGIKSYKDHLEISSTRTYRDDQGKTTSIHLHTSILLLSKIPMTRRYADSRVKYFQLKMESGDSTYDVITRWKLQPKPEDMQKYKLGELVEPEKPIVFYIDPITPAHWVPYFIAGVNLWQKVFEKAGFKNAVYARPAPTPAEDPEWSLYSAKYTAIIYQNSDLPNSSFSTVVDPRSGEILETHVKMYRGVFNWQYKTYFVLASAVDTNARKPKFDQDLIGELVKIIVAHEVGHTLGFEHNQMASNAVEVEKLRDRNWLMDNGITTSIMDYARINYVAQPGDSINFHRGLINGIGAYDQFAIEYGYRIIDGDSSTEKKQLRDWVTEKRKDKRYLVNVEEESTDPRSVSETVGDDGILASHYGLKNLQLVLPNIRKWADGAGNQALKELYVEWLQQFGFLLRHVAVDIGGLYRTISPDGVVSYSSVETGKQKQAVEFLHQHLFLTPLWVLDNDMVAITGKKRAAILKMQQEQILMEVLTEERLRNVLNASNKRYGQQAGCQNIITLLRKRIFMELENNRNVDAYRKSLQVSYIELLSNVINSDHTIWNNAVPTLTKEDRVNVRKFIKQEFDHLKKDIQKTLVNSTENSATKQHWQLILKKIS